jgi:hypothetical protein
MRNEKYGPLFISSEENGQKQNKNTYGKKLLPEQEDSDN